MSPLVTAVEPHAGVDAARNVGTMSPGAIDRQIHEAERTLDRLKRDLAQAQARAQQQAAKLAEARRRMEQWRWVNAIAEGDPDAVRLAAISLAAQTQAVDAATKNNVEVAARVEGLQNRIERQIARYFDLQSRRRVGGVEKRRDGVALDQSERSTDRVSSQGVSSEPSGEWGPTGEAARPRRSANAYAGYAIPGDGV